MTIVNVGDEIEIEFEESAFCKRQILCTVVKSDYEMFELDFSGISPFYFQFLHQEQEIKLYYYTDDGVNVFESIIITSPIDGKFEVENPPNHQCIQRRNFVRAQVSLDMNIVDSFKNVIEKTKTINISGNGIKFSSTKKLIFGKIYDVFLFISSDNCICISGGIISIDNNDYVMEFTNIKDNDRNSIVRLCLQIQAKKNQMKKSNYEKY